MFCLISSILASGMLTLEPAPLKLKPVPTFPAANAAPFNRLPLFALMMSFAFPSPDHQATIPEGGGVHGAIAVTSAAALLDAFSSPPPETVTVFTTDVPASGATFTVTVSAG